MLSRTSMVLAGVLCQVPLAVAEPLSDSLHEVLAAYRTGQFDQAVAQLGDAATLIRATKAQILSRFLPYPRSGWSASEVEVSVSGIEEPNGASRVTRSYYFGGETAPAVVTVSLWGDSPMVRNLAPTFDNPLYLGGEVELVLLQGRNVLLNRADNSMKTLVGDSLLVSVVGRRGGDLETVKAYFKAIDFSTLEGAVQHFSAAPLPRTKRFAPDPS